MLGEKSAPGSLFVGHVAWQTEVAVEFVKDFVDFMLQRSAVVVGAAP